MVSWQRLYWFGQTVRLRGDTDAYETVATELRENWPRSDGKTSVLGDFRAYPLSHPRMLLLGGAFLAEGARVPFVAVLRSEQGALRFQLAGPETGAWLEWHPPGSVPASFRSGLDTPYELLRMSELQPGWYLTHYQP